MSLTDGSGRREMTSGSPSAADSGVRHRTMTTPGEGCSPAAEGVSSNDCKKQSLAATSCGKAPLACAWTSISPVRNLAQSVRVQLTRDAQHASISRSTAHMTRSPVARSEAFSTARSPRASTACGAAPGSRQCCCQHDVKVG